MRALFTMMRVLLQGNRRSFAQGLALSLVVLIMGVSLLALSGWFITAAAAAGMIGLGTVFNVFAPSAMVRFLGLGRTVARYGERLTTHDATLRALSTLRVRLLAGVLRAPHRTLEKLRASVFLNRVTADVDALDGLALRLLLPGAAGLAVIVLSALVVAVLVHPWVAGVLVLGYGAAPTLLFLLGQRHANTPAKRAEAGMQALRTRLIDLIAVREELIAFGQLQNTLAHVAKAASYQSVGRAQIEKIERDTGFGLEVIGWAVVALSLGLGAALAQAGALRPAQAAIGIFAALALAEAVAPVRRALSDIGRMRSAARRIVPMLDAAPGLPDAPAHGPAMAIIADQVQAARGGSAKPLFAPLSFVVNPGETVALTGRSGCGKSTVLLMAAGQITASHGTLHCGDTGRHGTSAAQGQPRNLVMVPQRHALMAGTIAENLRIAAPQASDEALWAALQATELAATITAKGGLATKLGFRGAGLSGGEARRLVLARALLTQPAILLLDEPTEGLEPDLAEKVLQGIRLALPRAAILMAAHRPEEIRFADHSIGLTAA